MIAGWFESNRATHRLPTAKLVAKRVRLLDDKNSKLEQSYREIVLPVL